MDQASPGTGTATSLLKNRSFLKLAAAQFSAVTAVYALSLAGVALVEEQTHSSAQTGLAILSAILPAFLGSLVAGVVVDRWERRRGLVTSHLVRIAITLAFWAGTQLQFPTLALATVYVANFAIALFSQFALTAELALLPDLVDRAALVSANSVLQVSMLVAEGLGIVALGPLLIKLFSVPAVGLAGTGLCLLATLLAVTLPRDQAPARSAEDHASVWATLSADLQAGWRVIARDRLLLLAVLQATVAAMLLLVLISLLPGLATRHLGLNVEDAPLLVLPGGLGFVAGSFLVSRRRAGQQQRPARIAAGLIGLGLCVGLLGLLGGTPDRLWLVVLLVGGIGLALALVIISARVVLQERPPASMRGRVISTQLALGNAVAVLPLYLGGSLADHLGIGPVMSLLGLVPLGVGAAGLYYARR